MIGTKFIIQGNVVTNPIGPNTAFFRLGPHDAEGPVEIEMSDNYAEVHTFADIASAESVVLERNQHVLPPPRKTKPKTNLERLSAWWEANKKR